MTAQPLHITFTICTRNRLDLLEKCLTSLIDQPVPDGVRLDFVVCENDTEPKSKPLCDSLGSRVIYVQEPEPGLSPARNTSVERALETGCDWIGFFDDDEEAEPGWADAMVVEIRRDRADVITGPAFPYSDPPIPQWVLSEEREPKPTGTTISSAGTNDTVCRRSLFAVDGLGLRFDHALRFRGGSDSELFLRARSAGMGFVWCEEMAAVEWWPAERAAVKGQLRRAQRLAENKYDRLVRQVGESKSRRKTVRNFASRIASSATVLGTITFPFDRHLGRRRLLSGA
ncbi:glycosyltransferase family 2 protein [Roseobacter sp. HKCCA0434]|uniref:glycosyltransferase family 2 protein n=1 Tax=Roseobacter sp. HKCCA0434 TaxID=3079297 RepID=UPI002905AFD9|nr:glycosyltransferase family 2 protein [Roseobacter sp. HKCCA0434]